MNVQLCIQEIKRCCDGTIEALCHDDVDTADELLLDAMFTANSLEAFGLRKKLQKIRYLALHKSLHEAAEQTKFIKTIVSSAESGLCESRTRPIKELLEFLNNDLNEPLNRLREF